MPVNLPDHEIARFCQKYGVRKLSLFGSVLREDFRPDSDVDVLIELPDQHGIGLFAFTRMERELSDILNRKVDLNTPGFLSDAIRDDVIQSAKVLYEHA